MSALSGDIIDTIDRIAVARRIGHALTATIAGLECTDRQARDGAVDIVRVMLCDLDTATDELNAILTSLAKEKAA
jgi:hypothetical protein